ncbi:hypothetical protein D3C72_1245800 [compost metagenome]
MTGKVFDLVAFVDQAPLPEPLLGQESVDGVLRPPVVRGHHVVLELTVVLTFSGVPPAPVSRTGLEVDVVVIGVVFRPLIIQRDIDVAFPHQILDHRFWLENLLDARQFDRLRSLAVGQRDLAVVRRFQRFGFLTTVGILLDQQLLIAVQGLDLFPVDRHRTGVLGLDQQLSAIEQRDLAAQLVTVLQPHGIGQQGRGCAKDGETQQGSGQHKQNTGSGLREKSALSVGTRP